MSPHLTARVRARGRRIAVVGFLGAWLIPGAPVAAEAVRASSQGTHEWSVFGDLRNRLESDWDSQRSDGTRRDDRDRYRIRARLGIEWRPDHHWMVRVRGRTGSHRAQQSAHLTLHDFDGGRADRFDAVLDQWFLQGKFDRISLWAGRNDFPFFYGSESQEFIWDKDATLTGGFASWTIGDRIAVGAGGFALPDGMDHWNGVLWAGQVVARQEIRGAWVLKAAASFLGIAGGAASGRLPDGNGSRDYRIGLLSAQSLWTFGRAPGRRGYVRLGLDGIRNLASYSSADPDPVTAGFHDARDGVTASAAVGIGQAEGHQRWDWELDYAYGHVEKLAVNASYAGDDLVRWGTRGQATASDLKAHQVGLHVWLWKDRHHTLELHTRAFVARALSSVEDGKRFRLDLTYSSRF